MITNAPRVYSYFPGCSLTATNRAYDTSTRCVAQALGITLQEIDDWNCCGATAFMGILDKCSYVLSARNLAIAEKEGRELVTICNACYVALRKTNHQIAEHPDLSAEIRAALQAGDMDYHGTTSVRHFLDVVVNDVGEEAIRREVKKDMSALQVACYSGCQLSRPFDDRDHSEHPTLMPRLVEWLGAVPVPFPLASKCCGGMAMTTRPKLGEQLTGNILKAAKQREASCVSTACPLCQVNLEAYQRRAGRAVGSDCKIPVLYFTQLMGFAFGLDPKELALKDCLTPVQTLLTKKVGAS